MATAFTRAELFPTLVYEADLSDKAKMNAALLEAILAERAADANGVNRSNEPTLGGWHSRVDLHKDPAFSMLARQIRDVASGIAGDLGYAANPGLDFQSMWAIVNPDGASNRAHVHPGALWSGVYYVDAGENAGDIEFSDPRVANVMQQPMFSERGAVSRISVSYSPKPGRMLIFPAWLYHAVRPNNSGRDRVIVSFNLRAT